MGINQNLIKIINRFYRHGVVFVVEQNATVPSAFSQDVPKAFAQRIDNGEKFLEGLLRFLQTRAELEASYVKKLREWQTNWDGNITKQTGTNPELVKAFRGLTMEAKAQADVHDGVNEKLLANISAIKEWREENYTKKGTFSSGTKEAEEIRILFENAQKPWQDALAKCRRLRDDYYRCCREEIQAEASALAETANSSKDSVKVQNLQKVAEMKKLDKTAAKERYKSELATLPRQFPEAERLLKEVLAKIKSLEEQRLQYIKKIWVNYLAAVDTSNVADLAQSYRQIQRELDDIDLGSDLRSLEHDSMEEKPDIPVFEDFEERFTVKM